MLRAAAALVLATASLALAATHLTGGGRTAGDCLAGLDVIGAAAAPRARVVSCRDGDRACDRDGLVNGSCVYWVRACLDTGDACPGGGVTSAVVEDASTDADPTTISRTLDLIDKPILEQVLGGGGIYDGAAKVCRTDAACAGFGTGRCVPANLVFGELAQDEMCIMPGLFYRCPTDGTPCIGGSATN